MAAATLAWTLVGLTSSPAPTGAGPQGAINRFFARYVRSDGRVVRTDQGGDTVSEGQAYAMLLAVASGSRTRFTRVWGWTQQHLQQPSGLLAYHWSGGKVVSTTPAADADLDAAWALALASSRWDDPAYAHAGSRIAAAILAREVATRNGRPLLVAGPWARGTPGWVDPSYFSPLAYAVLGRLTSDPRWNELAASSRRVLGRLTAGGRLPPDWAALSPSGVVLPSAGPDGAAAPTYGLDAARSLVWYATACKPADRALAGGEWPVLSHLASNHRFPIKVSLAGHSRSGDVNPLMAVADAASATATGDKAKGLSLLDTAGRLNRSHHTYYGSAWVALGRVLLQTSSLGSCGGLG
jgi:endoglucanase